MRKILRKYFRLCRLLNSACSPFPQEFFLYLWADFLSSVSFHTAEWALSSAMHHRPYGKKLQKNRPWSRKTVVDIRKHRPSPSVFFRELPCEKFVIFLCLFSISLYPWTSFFSSACVCGCFCPLLFSPFLSKAQTNATFTICVRLIVLGYLKNIFFLEREVLARFCLMFKVWLLLCPVVVVFLSV